MNTHPTLPLPPLPPPPLPPPPPLVDDDVEMSPMDYELARFQQSLESYNLAANDPLLEMQAAIDSISKIKDAIPAAVAESLGIVTEKISTQVDLRQRVVVESIAQSQAQVAAIDDRLQILQQQINSFKRNNLPTPPWQFWVLSSCGLLSVIFSGYSAYQSSIPIPTYNEKTLECRPLSAEEKTTLGKSFKGSKFCSILM
jgi:hypothetical protein